MARNKNQQADQVSGCGARAATWFRRRLDEHKQPRRSTKNVENVDALT